MSEEKEPAIDRGRQDFVIAFILAVFLVAAAVGAAIQERTIPAFLLMVCAFWLFYRLWVNRARLQ